MCQIGERRGAEIDWAIVVEEQGMSADKICFSTKMLRKQNDLPRYIVVKSEYVGHRSAAFPAHVMLNDAGPFERNIRPWGKGSDVFFFNLTATQCAKANIDTNDKCVITITPLD